MEIMAERLAYGVKIVSQNGYNGTSEDQEAFMCRGMSLCAASLDER